MEEKDKIKVTLGTVICMFIILILVFALIIVYYFGFIADRNKVEDFNTNANLNANINKSNENIANSNITNIDNNVSKDNKIEFKPANYVIQFDANILGEEFETSGNEIKGHDYGISFLDNNKFTISMGFGNSVEGTYTIANNIINCTLTSASGEYSPTQEISGKISFKIKSVSEIEIIDIPDSYTIRTSERSKSGWILTDETKKMGFWPLVEGIKYVSDK